MPSHQHSQTHHLLSYYVINNNFNSLKPCGVYSEYNIVVRSSLFFQHCRQAFDLGCDHHGAKNMLLCLVFNPGHQKFVQSGMGPFRIFVSLIPCNEADSLTPSITLFLVLKTIAMVAWDMLDWQAVIIADFSIFVNKIKHNRK